MSAALNTTDYKQLTTAITGNMRKLKAGVPDVIAGFNAMGKAALAPGVLDAKTKELIALAIGVAARCDGCLGFHTQALARLGATREEVNEMLGVAVYMGGGPSLMYAANAVAAFDEALGAQAQ
ncbi:carboxymuconolactone decarboxylase family protein [Comamonas sp. NLF-1-9]|uniref:carboxymuconolactone decarboxylase family protein n=1 Tax=Comamonas sp. NLF-1-9 TaxID=2853163 RepID=UPI001C491800|nr:carboxymuconolactone decarboxylase family protein [Comamonas sp. NLF-1-9]QXL83309.1 carboxymuconolactone decarboxylase family protein [Comamonas sp. NLF-1-9]